ncbi:hypothetical protein [Kitasatospora sp. NPDC101183]|uniref:hypothetical protein n=1 Tax=Kitasatospora sp. NPDC101183 TaxID=3364100 RepID=UPI003811A958
MSKVKDLQAAQQAVTKPSSSPFLMGATVIAAIAKALAVPAPAGNPGTIRERAKTYADTAASYANASGDLRTVAVDQLPNNWTGTVAEHATQAVKALASELAVSQRTLEEASTVLNAWADDLEGAQGVDARSVAALETLQKAVGHDLFDVTTAIGAIEPAHAAMGGRITAAQRAEAGGTHAASRLGQLAAKARAERADNGAIDPLAALVLANEKGPGGSEDGDYILSPYQLERADQFLSGMNAADQAAFKKLLADAKSPEESAYLWKALAAGRSPAEVQQFAALIHPHGDDPTWLAQHLVPTLGSDASASESTTRTVDLTYKGESLPGDGYGQGQVNDCVAASTSLAHLKLDPVTMLQLTTGNTPEVPGADSSANFSKRLSDYYIGAYNVGTQADGSKPYPEADPGIGDKGTRAIVDHNLASTGNGYQNVSLKDEEDRRAALPRIDQAVDAGKPVPIAVGDGKGFHEMVIVARDGDRYQVWNPWGHSEWVTRDQFLDNHMNAGQNTGSFQADRAYGVELPK